jgi:hypothetical protein
LANYVLTTTYTAGLAGKEPTIAAGTTSQYWRGDKTWQTLNKSVVGLGNVNNTSDVDKPVSTAQQDALDLKANIASPSFTGTATLGANVSVNTTTIFVGDGTANARINTAGSGYFSANVSVGANVLLTVSSVQIGNATANLRANSVSLNFNGVTVANSTQATFPAGVFSGTVTAGLFSGNGNSISIIPTGGNTSLTLPNFTGSPVFDIRAFGAAPGSGTDSAPAINAAIANAVALGRASVYIPPGNWYAGSIINLANQGNSDITIFGHGPEVSSIIINHAGNAVVCGNASATGTDYSLGWTIFQNLDITHNVGDAAAMMTLHAKRNVVLDKCNLYAPNVAFLQIGSNSTSVSGDDVSKLWVRNSRFQGGKDAGFGVDIQSGSCLWFSDCFFNGTGTSNSLFNISSTNKNVDGLWITQCLAEDWSRSFTVRGKGVSNWVVTGGAYDRYDDIASVWIEPESGGHARWITFQGVNLGVGLASKPGIAGIYINAPAANAVYGINIMGCNILSAGDRGVKVTANVDCVSIIGNAFTDCGHDGVPIITAGANNITIVGNVDKRYGTGVAPTYGVEWTGNWGRGRKSGHNSWTTVSSGAESGVSGEFCGALVTHAGATGVNYSGGVVLDFANETYDYGPCHDTGVNPSRLTVPAGFTKTELSACIQFNNVTASTSTVSVFIQKNGSTTYAGAAVHHSTLASTGGRINIKSPKLMVSPGDYFEILLVTSGDTSSDVNSNSWFAMECFE